MSENVIGNLQYGFVYKIDRDLQEARKVKAGTLPWSDEPGYYEATDLSKIFQRMRFSQRDFLYMVVMHGATEKELQECRNYIKKSEVKLAEVGQMLSDSCQHVEETL